MDDFYFSLLFGGSVIALFSLEQFERPTYERSQELTRLVKVLLPSDLRRSRVYYPAYLFYAGLLVGIYALLCIFFSVPLLKLLGFAVDGNSARSVAPLMISLAMVGLAPPVPVLQRFEERIRFAAHRLSGIPARLLYGCRMLNAQVLQLPEHGTGYLIPDSDWERMRRYCALAANALKKPEDFARDLPKLIAYRAWFLEQRLVTPTGKPKLRIHQNETELKTRIDGLILNLDTLVSLPVAEQSQEVWEKCARETDETAADVCAMMVLYVEHELIRFVDDGAEETAAARAALESFLGSARVWAEESAVVGAIWVRASVTTVIAGFLIGIVCSQIDETLDMLSLEAAAVFAVSAFFTYSPALLIALHLHDHWVRSGRWINMAENDWSSWMARASGLFFISAAVGFVCLVALNLYWAMLSFGPDRVLSLFWDAAWMGAIYEGPRAVLGPLLALGIVALIDTSRTRSGAGRYYTPIAIAAAVMAAWAGLAKCLSSQYAHAVACGADEECLSEIPGLIAFLSEEQTLLAALQAGALGLAALLVCRRLLLRGFGGMQPQRRRILPRRLAAPSRAAAKEPQLP